MRKKVYSVEFNQYSNYWRGSVSNNEFNIGSYKSVDMPEHGSFLIFEDKIEFYKQFGDGYKALVYVGEIEVDDE